MTELEGKYTFVGVCDQRQVLPKRFSPHIVQCCYCYCYTIYKICCFRDKLTAFEVPLLQVHYHAIRSFLYIEELLSLSLTHTLLRLKYSTRILAELSHKLDRLLFWHSLQASSSALEMAQFALLLLPSTPFSPSPFYLALFGVPF